MYSFSAVYPCSSDTECVLSLDLILVSIPRVAWRNRGGEGQMEGYECISAFSALRDFVTELF